jgi:hypothetical protein
MTMTLTKEELTELTRLINERRDELEHGLSSLSPGDVRMAYDVLIEWLEGQAATTPAPSPDRVESIDTYALSDAYHFGFERGKEAMRRELDVDNSGDSSSRLVTNSAPEPRPEDSWDGDVSPDHPDAKWRDLMRDLDVAIAAAPREDPPKVHPEGSRKLTSTPPPIGPNRLPDPDQARANIANALAAVNEGNGNHAFDFTPSPRLRGHNAPKGRGGHVLPTRDEVVAFLRKMAMGNTMPTMEQFNTVRPGNWATVQAHILRLGVSWDELRLEAGLAPNPRNRNAQIDE